MRGAVMLLVVACHAQAPTPIAATSPEVTRPRPASVGCTDSMFHRCPRTVVTSTSVTILDDVHFVGNTTVVAPTSVKVLDAIADTLIGNPSILVVEVTAFGGPSVERARRQTLGDRRARVIVDYLVQHGVEAHRLRPRGIAEVPPGRTEQPTFAILQRQP